MIPLGLLLDGQHEGVKAAVHGTAAGLGALMCGYNAVAWLVRRERHLAVNAWIYFGFTLWELDHVDRHLADRGPVR